MLCKKAKANYSPTGHFCLVCAAFIIISCFGASLFFCSLIHSAIISCCLCVERNVQWVSYSAGLSIFPGPAPSLQRTWATISRLLTRIVSPNGRQIRPRIPRKNLDLFRTRVACFWTRSEIWYLFVLNFDLFYFCLLIPYHLRGDDQTNRPLYYLLYFVARTCLPHPGVSAQSVEIRRQFEVLWFFTNGHHLIRKRRCLMIIFNFCLNCIFMFIVWWSYLRPIKRSL